MSEDVYQKLCDVMAERGGLYPGMDIPEFYEMTGELFTEDEAAVTNVMPRGFNPASVIADAIGKSEEDITPILEKMADKGLCIAGKKDDIPVYGGPPFMPGIFEYQFMRGTTSEKDKKLARLIKKYKLAVDDRRGRQKDSFPTMRVIPVNRTIKAGNQINTYDQAALYIEKYKPLSVSTCYCRHQARLIDENDHCGNPDEVCMQFGRGAQFVIDRGMGREINKQEALQILLKSEEAGLIHCSTNRQEIDWLCNCCSCHCVILNSALSKPKPGLAVNSGFQPEWELDLCTSCETCIERCPTNALTMNEEEFPEVDMDRCIGCGVCATGCPSEAIGLKEREEIPVPPYDLKALRRAIQDSEKSSK